MLLFMWALYSFWAHESSEPLGIWAEPEPEFIRGMWAETEFIRGIWAKPEFIRGRGKPGFTDTE